MKNDDISEILQKDLKSSRFQHTLGVAYTASALAMRYQSDINNAYLAGLLHDCAKAYDVKSYIGMAEEYNIEISDFERKSPHLLHAKLGAYLAKEKFEVDNDDILNAIIYHTTGKPDMSLLEKIVYVADYIEPGRDKANRLSEIRTMAFVDIDKSIAMILEDTITYLEKTDFVIDPKTEETFKYYKGVH